MMKTLLLNFIVLILLFTSCAKNDTVTLTNEQISVQLSLDNKELPFIKKAQWNDNNKIIFSGSSSGISVKDWLPENFIGEQKNQKNQDIKWTKTQDSVSTKAQVKRTFNEMVVTWHYQLIKNSSVIRTWVTFKNTGTKKKVPWYPIWQGSLDFGPNENSLKYWDALEYTPHRKSLATDSAYTLQSRVYSSDPRYIQAQLPYWKVSNQLHSIYFGISWCGGWNAQIRKNNQTTQFHVWLPPEETQLELKEGEKISGPKLILTSVRNPEVGPSRSRYFRQKEDYAHLLYDMPESRFPLVYNHWYATRFNLTGNFIIDQLKELQTYNFEVFVVDAGWYESAGNWYPARKKFKPGEFESALRQVKDYDIDVGIWSCPWLISGEKETFPSGIDTSAFYREFIDAYAIDMAGSDFTNYLLDHINHLQSDYMIDWWKYDQEFMGENNNGGNIKNIIALQSALKAVREKNPGLYIENCMSGGRMINDFTNTLAQIHWIKDGGHNGLGHARENIKTALGASEILPLSKVERWTNRVDEIKDPELLRYYCRSAMIGVWGISADMHKVSSAQKDIILGEISHYRKLNELKYDNIYQISHPGDGDIAAITYFNASRNKASVMIFRWKQQGQIKHNLELDMLTGDNNYLVKKANTSQSHQYNGSRLKHKGLPIVLEGETMSAIYYINKQR